MKITDFRLGAAGLGAAGQVLKYLILQKMRKIVLKTIKCYRKDTVLKTITFYTKNNQSH